MTEQNIGRKIRWQNAIFTYGSNTIIILRALELCVTIVIWEEINVIIKNAHTNSSIIYPMELAYEIY